MYLPAQYDDAEPILPQRRGQSTPHRPGRPHPTCQQDALLQEREGCGTEPHPLRLRRKGAVLAIARRRQGVERLERLPEGLVELPPHQPHRYRARLRIRLAVPDEPQRVGLESPRHGPEIDPQRLGNSDPKTPGKPKKPRSRLEALRERCPRERNRAAHALDDPALLRGPVVRYRLRQDAAESLRSLGSVLGILVRPEELTEKPGYRGPRRDPALLK